MMFGAGELTQWLKAPVAFVEALGPFRFSAPIGWLTTSITAFPRAVTSAGTSRAHGAHSYIIAEHFHISSKFLKDMNGSYEALY